MFTRLEASHGLATTVDMNHTVAQQTDKLAYFQIRMVELEKKHEAASIALQSFYNSALERVLQTVNIFI